MPNSLTYNIITLNLPYSNAKGEQPSNLGQKATLREQPNNLGQKATLREQPANQKKVAAELCSTARNCYLCLNFVNLIKHNPIRP
ncbi:MAG: hypothetical protein F6K37_32630 [Moorea sp. SIO4E2]|uniref:hypothetical protein n=1 Tax=Moorena sp. SIO4E2 TaxID=2607826 RepID=UPI0013BD5E4D|nr:hypothetical protein [Moorena sp. SIO4E2]NEQ10502.1 hypothetical protein [Moorena sp. SIO4E2]